MILLRSSLVPHNLCDKLFERHAGSQVVTVTLKGTELLMLLNAPPDRLMVEVGWFTKKKLVQRLTLFEMWLLPLSQFAYRLHLFVKRKKLLGFEVFRDFKNY